MDKVTVNSQNVNEKSFFPFFFCRTSETVSRKRERGKKEKAENHKTKGVLKSNLANEKE